jgi:hypothetical protein
VTYTDASPTVPELYPKGSDAVQQINANVFAPATAWSCTRAAGAGSRRARHVEPAARRAGRDVAFNPIAVGEAAGTARSSGSGTGCRSSPTATSSRTSAPARTRTPSSVVSGYNLLFWQEGDGMPRQLRFEQSNAPQSVRLAVWGYSAFSAGRYPAASAAIDGTGLVAPTF